MNREGKAIVENDSVLKLVDALPLRRRCAGETVVIKYGGSAMTDPDLERLVIRDILLLQHAGVRPVLVHGGGAEVSALMRRVGKEPAFLDGLRVTDAETMDLAEMVLAGTVNKRLVGLLQHEGAKAVGICGKDGGTLMAEKHVHIRPDGTSADLGFVGDVTTVASGLIELLVNNGYVPVVSSIGLGSDGATYNINADTAAAAVARQCACNRAVFLTDVDGVLHDTGAGPQVIRSLTAAQARELIADGIVTGGMVPKVQACLEALQGGTVAHADIINGARPHALLHHFFGDPTWGTRIASDAAESLQVQDKAAGGGQHVGF